MYAYSGIILLHSCDLCTVVLPAEHQQWLI
jgi:hypothetical protein